MPIRSCSDEETIKKHLAVAEWNMLWEAGQFRRRFFDDENLTVDLRRIADRGDHNVIFVPHTRSRYSYLVRAAVPLAQPSNRTRAPLATPRPRTPPLVTARGSLSL